MPAELPQAAFPYGDLVTTNKARSRSDMEYQLLDSGFFNGDRYFDIFVEYAKQTPEDILIQITVCNRGPEPPQDEIVLHFDSLVLPHRRRCHKLTDDLPDCVRHQFLPRFCATENGGAGWALTQRIQCRATIALWQ